jgi:MFS family permease
VSRTTLVTANSLFMATMVMTLLIGAPLAQLVSRAQLQLPYVIASALFVGAGLSIAGIRSRLAIHQGAHRKPQSVIGTFMAGLHEVRRDRSVSFAFGQLSISILVMFMIFVLGPGYMSKVLHLAPQDTYAILGPAMAGLVITAALVGQFGSRWRRDRLLIAALMATGVTLAAMAVTPFLLRSAHQPGALFWFAAAFALLFGFEFGFLLIPSLTLLMERADEEMRGRVFGLLNTVINGVTAIPVLVAGALADLYGVNSVLAAMGVLLVLGGLFSLVADLTGHLPPALAPD